MADKTYTETVIEDVPFPLGNAVLQDVSNQPVNGSYFETKVASQEFPKPKFATEVLSLALNTRSRKILQEFQFTKSGALQIGEYVSGVSGDVRISPNGMTARNVSGETTFNLDGDSGDAQFKGTVRASTFESNNLLTGLVDVGNPIGNSYVRIDGENNRIVVHDGTNPRILIGNI